MFTLDELNSILAVASEAELSMKVRSTLGFPVDVKAQKGFWDIVIRIVEERDKLRSQVKDAAQR